jgi:hypothetical protein
LVTGAERVEAEDFERAFLRVLSAKLRRIVSDYMQTAELCSMTKSVMDQKEFGNHLWRFFDPNEIWGNFISDIHLFPNALSIALRNL